jgi:hypothetical protein
VNSEPANDPRMVETITTLLDTNQVFKRTSIDPQSWVVGFDQFNNQTDQWVYDYGQGVPGALLRHTRTSYANATNLINGIDYSSPNPTLSGVHMRSLPVQQSVYDANGNEQARTTYEYDNYNPDANRASLVSRPSITWLDSAFTSSNPYRGNATAISYWRTATAR